MGFQAKEIENYLGRGVTLPITLVNGKWPIQSGVDLIRSSIQMILRWMVGTRVFLNEFGSKIEELLEEPNDEVLRQVAYAIIVEALNTWEKRVDLVDVSIERPDYYNLNLRVTYKVVANQRTDTFVFPFYSQITT